MPMTSPPETNLATFVEVLKRSNIVDSDRLRRTLKATLLSSEDKKPSADEVARKLVTAGLLTEWQAGKLLKGKYKGFYLGKYVMRRPLGQGGMGVVYEAEHSVLNTRVAVKLLPKAKNDVERSVSRFMAEARAAAKLNHPNLTRVHDCDVTQGRRFMVMELVQGTDLGELVSRNGPLSISLALLLLKQAAAGLEHAHEQGVIHRDVKPQNFLVNTHGELKVTDLGLALFQVDTPERHTRDGENSVVGTVDFVAPEQAWESTNVDRRADIYSLGCTLYFMLTGKPPFASGTLAQRIAKQQTAVATPISYHRSDCPSAVEKLCRMMMEKRPQDRIQSMGLVVDAAQQILEELPQHDAHDELSGISVGRKRLSSRRPARWNSTELLGLHSGDSTDFPSLHSESAGGFGLTFPEFEASRESETSPFNAPSLPSLSPMPEEQSAGLPNLSHNTGSHTSAGAAYWQPMATASSGAQSTKITERSEVIRLLHNRQFWLVVGLTASLASIALTAWSLLTSGDVDPVRFIKTFD